MRDKRTGRALSWAVEYNDGSIGMVYTLDAARRRGLARLCVASITAVLAAEGHPAVCFVVHGNAASAGMMRSLGFEEAPRPAVWAGFALLPSGPAADPMGPRYVAHSRPLY